MHRFGAQLKARHFMTDYKILAAAGLYFLTLLPAAVFEAWYVALPIAGLPVAGIFAIRKKYQSLLAQNRRDRHRLERLRNFTGLSFFEWSIDSGTFECCEHFGKLLGPSETGKLTYSQFLAKLHPDDQKRIADEIDEALKHSDEFIVYYRLTTQENEFARVRQHNEIIRNSDGKPVKLMGVIQNIDHSLYEASYKNQQIRRILLKSGLIGMLTLSHEGRILSANDYVFRLFGFDDNELKNVLLRTLIDFGELSDPLFDQPDAENTGILSGKLTHKNGSSSDVSLFIAPVRDDSGTVEYFIVLLTDLREHLKEDRTLLEREQRHKNTLIREVHHRIKNNLQGIFGLLQNNALEHPEAKAILEQSMLQINSLAITYGLQSKAENGEIYLCDIIQSSAAFCNRLFFNTGETVDLDIPTDHPIRVDRNNAVSLSLIVNELLLNAIKHSSGTKRKIAVSLSYQDNSAVFKVKNQPATLPAGFDFERSSGIGTGLSLVKTLMPDHARLLIAQSNAEVFAQLTMLPPLIFHTSQSNPFLNPVTQ